MSRRGIIPFLLFFFSTQAKGQIYFDSLYNSGLFSITNEGIWGGVLPINEGYVYLSFARDQGLFTSNTWIVQTDLTGHMIQSNFNGTQEQIFMPTALITNGAGYLGLSTYSEMDTDLERNQFSLHNFNTINSTDWVKFFGDSLRNDNARELIRCNDGGLLLVGQSTDYSSSTADMYIVKTDSIGNQLWEKYYGGNSWEAALSAVQTPDSGFLLLGWTRSYGAGQRDFYLVKTDSVGNQEWMKTYGEASNDGGAGILELADGNYLLIGGSSPDGVTSVGRIYKVDPVGTVIWQKNYAMQSGNSLFKTVELADGSLVSAGLTTTSGESNAGYLIKTDSEGTLLWQRKYNKSNSVDLFYSILATDDGGFLLSGQANDANGNQDAWLLKVDSVGCPYPNCLVGIDETEKTKVVVDVWPNPASEVVNVQLQQPGRAQITIIDMAGRSYFPAVVERSGVVGPYMQYDVSALPNGVYVLSVVQTEMKTSLKIVVQH
jgi:hypothetical protein